LYPSFPALRHPVKEQGALPPRREWRVLRMSAFSTTARACKTKYLTASFLYQRTQSKHRLTTIEVASVPAKFIGQQGESPMKDAHNKAAEHHESAAKSHRSAADSHGKNDHAKGKEHSNQARQQSQSAEEHSKAAHTKSNQQK